MISVRGALMQSIEIVDNLSFPSLKKVNDLSAFQVPPYQ